MSNVTSNIDKVTEALGERGIGPSYFDGVNLNLWGGGFHGFVRDMVEWFETDDPDELAAYMEAIRQLSAEVRQSPELANAARENAEYLRERRVIGAVVGPEWFLYGLLAVLLYNVLLPVVQTEVDIHRVKRIQKKMDVDQDEAVRLLGIFTNLRKSGALERIRGTLGLNGPNE